MAARDQRIVHVAMEPESGPGSHPTTRRLAMQYDVQPDGSPAYVGPVEADKGWTVLKIFARHHPYVLEYSAAEETVAREIIGKRMGERLRAMLDEDGQRYGLKIDWKAIA